MVNKQTNYSSWFDRDWTVDLCTRNENNALRHLEKCSKVIALPIYSKGQNSPIFHKQNNYEPV